jgi:hypothetical protein
MKRSLEICIKIARKELPNHPDMDGKSCHWTFIFQSGKLIEWATNRCSNPPSWLGYPEHAGVHSEINAYRKAKGLLDKKKSFDIVNIRLNRQSDLRNSYPCKKCFSKMKALGCQRMYFSTDIGMCKTC